MERKREVEKQACRKQMESKWMPLEQVRLLGAAPYKKHLQEMRRAKMAIEEERERSWNAMLVAAGGDANEREMRERGLTY